ncbi:phosphate transport system protein [Anseongella ginsenosidimutans]|uniref:Phosphate-specific transport system accessory protein PhoU n=1 Tax=Anseongella ginsenosidimutans TaxID=496056 RepID=A0A4R3KPU3_9SPHI|nr:phosphate signaling complex protein PhoU [Anseongella ginsenosidimutans]QEC52228.1 phosphate signaling complex protein PhoU [Anseongella ginsenosidimutans]TCS86778.1 phosphate transport system protein [Anseongella ginsenosidimutans]
MKHLEEDLQRLKSNMVDMSNLVISQIHKGITALINNDKAMAREVIFNEKRVNAYELRIDKDCENIITLQNPMAHDMRFVFATLKINSNMERIGDNAEGIAKYAMDVEKDLDNALIEKTRLLEMTDTVKLMIANAAEAYLNNNGNLGRAIFNQDMILDEINAQATGIIADYVKHNPDNIIQALYLLSIIRKLERVGDHITNIAEEVIFYLEAKILKHGKKDED